ncbi:hypothetical protein BDBG_17285 [Blastomyces gilchristii SLH14081]|uniref:Uncharacterized protein n=1 Tax=Blastomyces gilchristii (strain SLH14081) TaxID=559298 RepID=A0A179UPV2_BLAGS|nr:uncharacterized protein BDBG_17285 [Blastomyces gilchristii SLH14081]OAT09890.1 hypothetical protein BDBG_17285 [Blastomyces gilchristii SLH14081]
MPVNTRSTNHEETPENQTTAPESFPTPITARKPPHNNNNQDNNNMADEAAALRRHIAQMNEELHQMRASSNPTATATVNDGNDLSPDLAAYLQNQGDTPALSRVLQEFREHIKYLQKPGLLKSTSDYSIWKEEILLVVKQSHTEDILTSKPLKNASKDMKRFWEECNSWLYNFVWSSVSIEAKSLFTILQDSLSSAALWNAIAAFFSEQVEICRALLFKEFNDISATATYDGSNHLFIEHLLAIRVEYIHLEYANIPNFIFFDKLLNGLTKKWSTFIRDCMNYAAKDDNVTSLEDDFLDLYRDILLRLPLDDKNARDDTKNAKDTIKKDKDNKKNNKKCTHCKQDDHEEPYCWFTHPEKRPVDWKDRTKNNNESSAPTYTTVEHVY